MLRGAAKPGKNATHFQGEHNYESGKRQYAQQADSFQNRQVTVSMFAGGSRDGRVLAQGDIIVGAVQAESQIRFRTRDAAGLRRQFRPTGTQARSHQSPSSCPL